MNEDLIILLGNNPDLAYFELKTVLNRLSSAGTIDWLDSPGLARVSNFDGLDIKELISVLGGCVKIARVFGVCQPEALVEQITAKLSTLETSKIVLAINGVGLDENELNLAKKVKLGLKTLGIAVRYVELAKRTDTAQAKQKNYAEVLLFKDENKIVLAMVEVWQNIDEWSLRDTRRPGINAKRGMLPPKLARMMVNSALPGKLSEKTVIYDPFCGSGTVLTEGLELGLTVVGSDISDIAIDDSRKNLESVGQNDKNWRLFVSDAVRVSENEVGVIDAIVTEPYLGPVDMKNRNIKDMVRGLSRMYLGAFKNLAKLQKSTSRAVVVTPVYEFKGVKKKTDFVDRLSTIGYTLVAGPFVYNRPQALVQREIFVLEKI